MSAPTENDFIEWLKAQSDRDDPVGDLATDYCSSGLDPRTFTLSDMCEEAREALNAALKEHCNITEYEFSLEDVGEE
jgi:hypothetical protein